MPSGKRTAAQTDQPQWKGYLLLVLFAFFVSWQTPFVTLLQNHGVPQIGTVTMLFVSAAVVVNLAADLVKPRHGALGPAVLCEERVSRGVDARGPGLHSGLGQLMVAQLAI